MIPNHDYRNIDHTRDILEKIQAAGIKTVIIDLTNASQWTDHWGKFEPMVNNIRTVTKEKGMTYFAFIGAQFVSDDYQKRMLPGGPFAFWNNIAGKIHDTWAKDDHYQRYGHGDDRPILLAFLDGKNYAEQMEKTAPEYLTHLKKFRIGNTQINDEIKNPHESDGWGYRSKWQNQSGSVRFTSPNGGVQPSSWHKISGEEWKNKCFGRRRPANTACMVPTMIHATPSSGASPILPNQNRLTTFILNPRTHIFITIFCKKSSPEILNDGWSLIKARGSETTLMKPR